MTEQRDDCDAAGARLVEVRGLGRARVDGRNGQAVRDVSERMRVADGQVVQPALDARVAADREIGLIAFDVERAAVDAADAQSRVACLARWQRHRQVVLPRFRSAGPGVQDHVRRELVREIVAVDDVHPRRQSRSKGMGRRPHRLRRQRIVIAGNEEDRDMRTRMIAERPGEPFPEVFGRRGVVEQVAGAQDRIDTRFVGPRRGCDAITSIRARDSFFCASSGNDGKRRPRCQSAVCSSSQHDVSGFGGAIRNDTWNSRVTVGARYRSS